MGKVYYLVSDLHMGGDAELEKCDYTQEFVAFLKDLETRGEDAELIIAGDTFGFWELTTETGVAQLDRIIPHHQQIMDQMRRTGEKITITMMVGNHDYDLACFPEFAARLAEYNIRLHTDTALVRQLDGRKLWVEHGQQEDDFNASPDYGNPYALPLGYFITEVMVSGASRHSAFGRGNWLKDIRSVGVTQIPDWFFSNYFYREMNRALRWIITPFLVLFGITFLALVTQGLVYLDVVDRNLFIDNAVLRSLGFVGNILGWIIIANMVIFVFMFIVAVPLGIMLRDIKRTLRRFRIVPEGGAKVDIVATKPYTDRAEQVLAEHPDVAVYAFGHTHEAFLKKTPDGRAILNTGTWLKILHRVRPHADYLPAVYVPHFRLNYYRIYENAESVQIEYVTVPKPPERELTWLQRLAIWRRPRPPLPEIPPNTTVPSRGA